MLTVAATLGALALVVHFSIDVIAGFMSADHLAMSIQTAQMRQSPALTLFANELGPYLFYLGQLGLVIQLAAMREIKARPPVPVLTERWAPPTNLFIVGVANVDGANERG